MGAVAEDALEGHGVGVPAGRAHGLRAPAQPLSPGEVLGPVVLPALGDLLGVVAPALRAHLGEAHHHRGALPLAGTSGAAVSPSRWDMASVMKHGAVLVEEFLSNVSLLITAVCRCHCGWVSSSST